MITSTPDVTSPAAVASREAVLEAAQRLILQHGYAGLSMRELARKSGLAKGTIYHHFEDKQDIYWSVLERDIHIVRNRIAEAAQGETDWKLQLRAIIETYFDLQKERRFVILMVLRETANMEARFCKLAKVYRDELLKTIGTVLEKGIEQGFVRPVNVELAVLSLLGILHSFIMHRLFLDNGEIGNDVVSHTLDIFLNGICGAHADGALPASSSEFDPAD